MRSANLKRWISLIVISVSGGVSFDLAYLRYIYQIPMVNFMHLSNTQVGIIMSTFGIAAIILYAPSGFIADRFSHKKVMSFSMIATGLLGFWMATYPPFWCMLIIQIGFAFSTIFFLWSVSVKAGTLLGTEAEQGKLMGWMEGFRGIGVMCVALVTMWVFSLYSATDPFSLKAVILIYGVIFVVLGILCWFFVDHNYVNIDKEQQSKEVKKSGGWDDIKMILKRKTTWYCCFIIFGVYVIYTLLSYSTNYLTEVYGLSLIAASFMGVIINKVFRAICGPIGGVITTYTRFTSPTRVICYLSVLSIIFIALILLLEGHVSATIGMVLIILMAFCCFASRGLYWACIGEVKTPANIVGMTIGVCSVIGFIPDVIIYPIIGHWQDTLSKAQAYHNMYLVGLVSSCVVIVFTSLLLIEIKKTNKKCEKDPEPMIRSSDSI